ncbi:MAG: T9SS type A sorting domain-containing protein, partial [Bacteroidales bacterium]|nr:T9SS type A sorting domain-containing protein [Bacteroidales bacterium]
VRVYYNNSGTWQQIGQDIDGEAAGDRSGWSVSLSADGNTITIGAKGNSGNGTEAGHVRVYKNNSDTWYQIAQDIDGEAAGDNSGSSVSLSADGNLAAIGAIYNDGNGTDSTGHVRVFALKGFFGKIYNDINDNCIADATEPGLAGRGVYITPGNYTLQTNEMGIWQIDSLLSGSYTVTVDTSGNWLPTCPISQTFTVTDPEGITVAPSFGFISIQPCAGPNVSVNMPFMRWGFSNQQIYVQVCNDYIATGALLDAYVDLELDSLISVDNASLGYADLGENSYRFNLGDINLGQCVAFSLSSTLSTEAILGQTLCMQANLYPADSCIFDTIPANPPGDFTPCDLPWDKSSLSLEGWCSNDSIFFSITNTGEVGEGDMQCYSPVRLLIDGEYQWLDSIMLAAQETFIYAFLGDGRTWRLEADQHPLHPGNSHPNATVEACGDLDQWTAGLVTILPMDDADPIVDIYCGEVTGSYDPNDKSAIPTGVGAEHKVLPNVPLEYMIRFQNTGTDTAFTVVITDTLDTDLNIFSVHSGASSHDYSFRIQGPRVLEWTFENIMLPDSNVNEAGSHGFVSFTVDQNPNLADDVEINNTANIYFDFNEPIITNTTSHIIDRNIGGGTIILGSENNLKANAVNTSIVAYPNPTTGELEIRLDKSYANVTAKVTDLTGRTISRHHFQDTQSLQLNIKAPSGMFFVELITDGNNRSLIKLIKE